MPSQLAKEIGGALPESAWRFVENTGTHIVQEADLGNGTRIQRRMLIGDEDLQAINKHLYDTSGRFSQREAGAIGTPIANVPLSVLYGHSEVARKIRAGDREHLKWWLNSEAGRPFRTHKGKV